jgi:hypothetical protein
VWHHLRLWHFDRTGTTRWSSHALLGTFTFTVIPEIILIAVYLILSRRQPEDRITSLRNPIFVVFLVLVVSVLALGEWFVQKATHVRANGRHLFHAPAIIAVNRKLFSAQLQNFAFPPLHRANRFPLRRTKTILLSIIDFR